MLFFIKNTEGPLYQLNNAKVKVVLVSVTADLSAEYIDNQYFTRHSADKSAAASCCKTQKTLSQ
jgi:hypothetical protein